MGAYLTTRFCALLPASRRHAVQVACLKARGPMGFTQMRAARQRLNSVLGWRAITTRMVVRALAVYALGLRPSCMTFARSSGRGRCCSALAL